MQRAGRQKAGRVAPGIWSSRIDESLVPESKLKKEAEEVERLEDEKIDKYISEGVSTLRLTRKNIKKLSKARSNKFILPLYSDKKDDIDKFMHLTKQPFSFLTYNNSMFSVNLTTDIRTLMDDKKNKLTWIKLIEQNMTDFNHVSQKIELKKTRIKERQRKIGKAYHKLSKHIEYLKEQFTHKVRRFPNSVYIKFIGNRTIRNIEIVREAEVHAMRQLEVLKNKQLIKNPTAFFKRAVTLFLGETGKDIIKDLHNLGYTSRDDHNLAIAYLYYLLKIVNSNDDNYTSPVIAILNKAILDIGFEKPPILKVIAGHMFIHTIMIDKKNKTLEEASPKLSTIYAC